MVVMEDGDKIAQAGRLDPRVTRLGRILRAASADLFRFSSFDL
jgi:hypothetical protein